MVNITTKLDYEDKWDYLKRLYNQYHYLEVCHSWKDIDGFHFSKWVRIHTLMLLGWKDKLSLYIENNPTKDNFVKKISHRLVLPDELLVDIDDTSVYNQYYPLNYSPTFMTMELKLKYVLKGLEKMFNISRMNFSIYNTGSRGYHISVMLPWLSELTEYQKQVYKHHILSELSCDTQKSASRCMIALEGEPHWKTGIKKELVDEDELWNKKENLLITE